MFKHHPHPHEEGAAKIGRVSVTARLQKRVRIPLMLIHSESTAASAHTADMAHASEAHASAATIAFASLASKG